MEKFTSTNLLFYPMEYKSQGKLGNLYINFTRTFNWFQRFMWKVCFGIEIKNLKEK